MQACLATGSSECERPQCVGGGRLVGCQGNDGDSNRTEEPLNYKDTERPVVCKARTRPHGEERKAIYPRWKDEVGWELFCIHSSTGKCEEFSLYAHIRI